MERETITAWFSYAAAQHHLVIALCDRLQSPAVEGIIQSAIASQPDIRLHEQKLVAQVRLQPKRYRWDDNEVFRTDERRYRLAPGASINELLFELANNPIRIIILSESYFRSQACLNELCLSLCATHALNRLPMLIFSGFTDVRELLSNRQFPFADPAQPDEIKAQTLLEALTATHQALGLALGNQRGFDLSAEFRQKLPSIINELAMRVYSTIATDNIEEVAINIYQYTFSFLNDIDSNRYYRLVENLYHDWGKHEFASILQEKINTTHDDSYTATDYFSQINSIEQAKAYFTRVYSTLDENRTLLKPAQSQDTVYQLYALVLLQCLKPIAASLLATLGSAETLIEVNVADDSKTDLQNTIHAALSFCMASGFAPQINANSSASNIDKNQMSRVIFPRKLSISGVRRSELHTTLKGLVPGIISSCKSARYLNDTKSGNFYRPN